MSCARAIAIIMSVFACPLSLAIPVAPSSGAKPSMAYTGGRLFVKIP